jgi:hypothetical protein
MTACELADLDAELTDGAQRSSSGVLEKSPSGI